MPRGQTTYGDNECAKSGFTPFLGVSVVLKRVSDDRESCGVAYGEEGWDMEKWKNVV